MQFVERSANRLAALDKSLFGEGKLNAIVRTRCELFPIDIGRKSIILIFIEGAFSVFCQ